MLLDCVSFRKRRVYQEITHKAFNIDTKQYFHRRKRIFQRKYLNKTLKIKRTQTHLYRIEAFLVAE